MKKKYIKRWVEDYLENNPKVAYSKEMRRILRDYSWYLIDALNEFNRYDYDEEYDEVVENEVSDEVKDEVENSEDDEEYDDDDDEEYDDDDDEEYDDDDDEEYDDDDDEEYDDDDEEYDDDEDKIENGNIYVEDEINNDGNEIWQRR
jgi:hypothetical protein